MKIRIVYRYTGKKTEAFRPGQFISKQVYMALPEEMTIRQEIRV